MTTPRVLALFREVAAASLVAMDDVLAVIDPASLLAAPAGVAEDPVLAQSVRAMNATMLEHYLRCVLADPAAPVQPLIAQVAVDLARDVVRRGIDTTALDAFRVSQNASWHVWMDRCFASTDDVTELRELLDVSARSVFAYIDATVAAFRALVASEQEAVARGGYTDRLAAVTLVLESESITLDEAGRRLRHDLRARQIAAVLWQSSGDTGRLEQAAEALGRALDNRPLVVHATASSLWLWCACADIDAGIAARATERFADVHVALGTPGAGLDGFRRGHQDALVTQRLLLRATDPPRVAAFDDIQLIVLLSSDEERAARFVHRTLGALATADPVLRHTLRIYLRDDSSASRAARTLFTHRNTVLARVGRAEALLPRPLAGRALAIASALEIVHWLGPGTAPDQ
jgi:DNA-binding PucR family transcriptional regulator